MAFNIACTLHNYEYRGLRTGFSAKTNRSWMSIILESPDDARQLDVSVPDDLQADIYNADLQKGDVLAVPVVAVAAQNYNFVRLTSVPILENAVDMGY